MLWVIPQAQKLPRALAQAAQQILLLTIPMELYRQTITSHSLSPPGGGGSLWLLVLATATHWSEVGQMAEEALRLACSVGRHVTPNISGIILFHANFFSFSLRRLELRLLSSV